MTTTPVRGGKRHRFTLGPFDEDCGIREVSVLSQDPSDVSLDEIRIDRHTALRGTFLLSCLPRPDLNSSARTLFLSAILRAGSVGYVTVRNLSTRTQHIRVNVCIGSNPDDVIEVALSGT